MNNLAELRAVTDDLLALADKWEARARSALPADAMLINKHVRELREDAAAAGMRTVANPSACELGSGTPMVRFTAYRRNLSQQNTHTHYQCNPDDQPQYEGVVFTDGSVAIRWLTACKSTSVWSTLEDLLRIHGHPEYGTDLIWHDGQEPEEWTRIVAEAALQQRGDSRGGEG